jgi:hypothetical protein
MLVIAFSIAAYPVFRSPAVPSQAVVDPPGEGLDELLVRRDAAYTALKELDLDFEMGKISETDHRTLRDRFRAEAVVILQQVDARQAEMQNQISKESEPERRPREQEIEQEIAARRQQRRAQARCPDCKAPIDQEDGFCRHCGAELVKEGV